MMNCTSRSVEGVPGVAQEYESIAWFDSDTVPGVRYAIVKFSLGRRIELARKIREIGRKAEFFTASDDDRDKLEAAVISTEIDRLYIEWGLRAIEGLQIDGEPATPSVMAESGPFPFAKEILSRIRSECGLSESEQKN